jgi:hypothetical protein
MGPVPKRLASEVAHVDPGAGDALDRGTVVEDTFGGEDLVDPLIVGQDSVVQRHRTAEQRRDRLAHELRARRRVDVDVSESGNQRNHTRNTGEPRRVCAPDIGLYGVCNNHGRAQPAELRC